MLRLFVFTGNNLKDGTIKLSSTKIIPLSSISIVLFNTDHKGDPLEECY
jgi:hypothetical protein